MKKIICFAWFIVIFTGILAQDTKENQKYSRLNIQYAGNIGFMSVGAGSGFDNNKIFIDFHYGYVHSHSEKSKVHTLALKVSPAIKSINGNIALLKLFVGSTFTYSITDNTYLRYPSYFPYSYYDFPNSFHCHPYVGILCIDYQRPIGGYLEFGSSDYKIVAAFRNSCLSFRDIFTVSFGISYFIHHPKLKY